MTTDARLLLYATLLTWLMIVVASMMRLRSYTPRGMQVGFGNREDEPQASPAAGRADRAARNMLENMVLFVALIVAAHLASAPQDRIDLGARMFFYARLAYFPIYVAGIRYVRTVVWFIGVLGLGVILTSSL